MTVVWSRETDPGCPRDLRDAAVSVRVSVDEGATVAFSLPLDEFKRVMEMANRIAPMTFDSDLKP